MSHCQVYSHNVPQWNWISYLFCMHETMVFCWLFSVEDIAKCQTFCMPFCTFFPICMWQTGNSTFSVNQLVKSKWLLPAAAGQLRAASTCVTKYRSYWHQVLFAHVKRCGYKTRLAPWWSISLVYNITSGYYITQNSKLHAEKLLSYSLWNVEAAFALCDGAACPLQVLNFCFSSLILTANMRFTAGNIHSRT